MKSRVATPSIRSFEYDKNFVPFVPSLVLSATVGNVTVVSKLYGEVNADRAAKERADLDYRVRQLVPVEKRVQQERVIPSRFIDDDIASERETPRAEKRRRGPYQSKSDKY